MSGQPSNDRYDDKTKDNYEGYLTQVSCQGDHQG